MSKNGDLPIGVFDSGLGGLTVLKTLREHMPNENFIYLGDTARIPYGSKSPRTIAKYLQQNLNFLISMKVKAVVIACNSASTVAHTVESNIPLYNVIEPGARTAAQFTHNGKIGIIATKATVAGKAYVSQIEKLNPEFKVFQQACPLLVPLVEEGWDEDPITNLIVYRYLSPLVAVGIDTLVLACTHYPILKNSIRKVMGGNVELIESGETLATQIQKDFVLNKLAPNSSDEPGQMRFLTTDTSEGYLALAQRILAPLTINNLELVDI